MSAVSVPIAAGKQESREATHLYTGFLHTARASRKKGDRYVRGALDMRIGPHYRDEGLFLDSRYEGADLLRDRLYIRLDPETLEVAYRWNATQSYRRVSPARIYVPCRAWRTNGSTAPGSAFVPAPGTEDGSARLRAREA